MSARGAELKREQIFFCIQLLLTRLKLEKLLLPFVVLKTCFTKKYLYFVSINYFRPLHCYKDWVFNFPFTKLRYNVVSISLLHICISVDFKLLSSLYWLFAIYFVLFILWPVCTCFFLKMEFKITHFCIEKWLTYSDCMYSCLGCRVIKLFVLCQEFAWTLENKRFCKKLWIYTSTKYRRIFTLYV